jgi:tetratricopeptide (TPR) repeat protein
MVYSPQSGGVGKKMLRRDARRRLLVVFVCSCMLGLMTQVPTIPWALAQGRTFRAPIPKPAQKAPAHESTSEGNQPEKQVTVDYEHEINRLNVLLKSDEKNTDALYNRAWLYERMGQLEMAEKDYTRVIQIDRQYKDAYYNRGVVYLKMKKYGEAVKDFSEVIGLQPGAVDAYCNRGNANLRLGKMDLALQDYDTAIKAKPDDGDLYFNRALVYLAKGAKSKAIEDFKKAAGRGHPEAKEYLKKYR